MSESVRKIVNGEVVGPSSDDLVDRAVDSTGELVLDFPARVGARPFARFTPYENHRGVRVHHWTVLSMYLEPMPGRTLLSEPHIVRPHEHEDYPLRHFSTPWIRQMVRRSRVVELVPVEDTPFSTGAWQFMDTEDTSGDANA
ncbi:hypothetical protein [Natrialba aegyptia]|uniref:Uncharacterized protein n=1 Tax=Natrialba aegyptia DSM 13077 TaxID=1227491 RepID=M0B664_9EURY|nr:hypothetical protein [Natrialba aegyptia]ELZ05763.1 hypothetical protein C480_10210 [Natrialba aegyptia DSM 13077]